MAWDNNPGGQQEGLPDLPEMIKKVGDSLSLGKGGKPLWLIVIVIVLAIFLAYTAFYTIAPGHQGVILRFGKYVRYGRCRGFTSRSPLGSTRFSRCIRNKWTRRALVLKASAPVFGPSMKRAPRRSENLSCSPGT